MFTHRKKKEKKERVMKVVTGDRGGPTREWWRSW